MMRSVAGWLTVAVLTSQSAVGGIVVLPVSEDAAVLSNDGFPSVAATNFGIFNYLYAGSYDPDHLSYSRSVMKFVLPPLSAGQTLQSATLRLVVGQEFPQTKQFDFFRVDDNWNEATVTWLSAPQPQPLQLPIATFNSAIGLGPTPPSNALTFDITPAVEAEQSSDPTQTLSILWKERDEDGACCNRLAARSKELAVLPENVPQIILTTVPEPSSLWILALLIEAMFMPRHAHLTARKSIRYGIMRQY